jgi:hypothetical protein
VWAGVTAGVLSTLIQVLLWLIFTDNFPDILYRDARLTAAILMGHSALPPPASFNLGIVVVATLIHFSLSIVYVASLAFMDAWLKGVPIIWVGVSFGVVLYVVNLYGFTEIFPWFAQTRGWITLIAHGVFGVVAISVYRCLNITDGRPPADVH